MAKNRWLIGIGIAVLALMALIAVFSLGVYVGRYGLNQRGMRLQPQSPGGAQPAAPPQALPQGAPGNQPDLVGMLRRGSADGLELATREGPRWVVLKRDTRLIDPQGNAFPLKDLEPGDLLAVFGEFTGGDGQQLLATLIVRLPEEAIPNP
jgi:hypothetical protein